jgi:hypothetical protein
VSTIHVRTRARLRSAKRKEPEAQGTQHWLEDPTVPVCPTEGCRYDAGTCGHDVRVTRPRKMESEPDRGGWV